jgi:glutathione synthase/RimK-type ligase-like ATP-grasp enzyme
MKIAIQNRAGSFSERWIEYCKNKNINYIIVNCYSNQIIEILKKENITHLMWHINHASSKDLMLFPYVMNSADKIGIKTFPNFETRWHFDDKIAQKYLFESISAPYIESHVSYSKATAFSFLNETELPIVAKLKRGAGSTNVKLIKTKEEATDYVNTLFDKGILSSSKPLENINQKIRIAKKIKNPIQLIKKTIGFLKRNKSERKLSLPEIGYVYFQKFMKNNSHDTRIIVVGDMAFGIVRYNSKNDFRASGSGKIGYDITKINIEMVKISFEITKKIGAQCLAFDFVYDQNNEPRIIEACFGFSIKAYDNCPGYWNDKLEFVEEKFNPQEVMISNFISNRL